MTLPITPVEHGGVGDVVPGGPPGGSPPQGALPRNKPPEGRKAEWVEMLDLLNMIAVDAVGATVLLALLTLADWVSNRIDSVWPLVGLEGTKYAFTAHGLFRWGAILVAATFALRSVIIVGTFTVRAVLRLFRRMST